MSTLKVGAIQSTTGNAAVTVANDGATTFSKIPSGILNLQTAQATTSGKTKDFTSIPSGVTRITVMLHQVQIDPDPDTGTSGTALIVQLGTSGGFKTSGYVSRSDYDNAGGIQTLDGFAIFGVNDTNTWSGIMTLVHMGSNIWVQSHAGRYNSTTTVSGGGAVTLSGTCDRLRIRPDDDDDHFSAGTVNIMYE